MPLDIIYIVNVIVDRNLPVLCEGDRVTRGPGWSWGNEVSS